MLKCFYDSCHTFVLLFDSFRDILRMDFKVVMQKHFILSHGPLSFTLFGSLYASTDGQGVV